MVSYCASIYTSLTIKYKNGGKNKMTSTQRMKNDLDTMDRRELADEAKWDNRAKNDELTGERRFKADRKDPADLITEKHRLKNDEATEEKRSHADITLEKNRLRNDEKTANRRETKDANQDMALAISLAALVVLVVVIIFAFI